MLHELTHVTQLNFLGFARFAANHSLMEAAAYRVEVEYLYSVGEFNAALTKQSLQFQQGYIVQDPEIQQYMLQY